MKNIFKSIVGVLLLASIWINGVQAAGFPPPATYSYDANGNIIGLSTSHGVLPISRQLSISATGIVPAQNTAYTQAGDATNGVVMNVQLPAVAKFYGVKLIYQNYSTTVPLVFDGVKITSSQTTVTGSNTSPSNNTLNSSPGFSAFVTASGSQTITVPVATVGTGGQNIPGVVVTDFMPIVPVARTDTLGAPYLLRVASHIQPSASTTTQPGLTQTPQQALNGLTANPGLITGAATFTGTGNTLANLTTTAGNVATYGSPMNPISAIFYYNSPTADVWEFGDSIIQGFGTTSQVAGLSEYLTFNSYGKVNQFVGSNFAQSGQKIVDTLARVKAIIGASAAAGYVPKYVVIKAWSPNDPGGTQASFDLDFGYTLEIIRYCQNLGITVIVMTSPFAQGTSTLALLQAQNAQVMALPASVKKVDLFNLWTPGGTWVSAYNSGDGVHPNDAGENIGSASLALQLAF